MKKVALMFPGQGKLYPGIYKDLYDRFSVVRETFEEASDTLGMDIRKLCFESSLDEILELRNSQKCVMTIEIAGYRLCKFLKIEPSVLIGHSFGECVAVVAAGVMPFSQGLKLGEKRAIYMQAAVPKGTGGMLVVMNQTPQQIKDLCLKEAGRVWVSNYNCPTQVVLSGELESIRRLNDFCTEEEIMATQVAVDVASHCPLMKPAADEMKRYLKKIPFLKGKVPIATNCTGQMITEPMDIKNELSEQLINPVQFEKGVNNALSSGVEVFIELGPGKSLTGSVKRMSDRVSALRIADVETLKEVCDVFGLGNTI